MPDMKNLNAFIADAIALSDPQWDEARPDSAWHKVGVTGSWDGHWMGPFTLTDRMFDEAIEHFNSRQGVETVVDYEHESFFGGGAAPAAGWISALTKKKGEAQSDSDLWAKIDWTKKAADMIRAKEYRYLSPTFVFNTRDRKSGKMKGASLNSVALTNTPFLTELPEVRLNSLRVALSQLLNEQDKETNMDEAKAKADAEALAKIGEKLGVEGTEAIMNKIAEMTNPARDAEVAAMRDRIATLEKETRETKATALVDAARASGKVTALNEGWAREYAMENPAGFEKWAATATPIVALGANVTPPKGDKVALSDGHKAICRAFGMKHETLEKAIERKAV